MSCRGGGGDCPLSPYEARPPAHGPRAGSQHSCTVLFRGQGVGGCPHRSAVLSRSTRGLREVLLQEGLSFSAPAAGEFSSALPDEQAAPPTRQPLADGKRSSCLLLLGDKEVQGLLGVLGSRWAELFGTGLQRCDVPRLLAPAPFPQASLLRLMVRASDAKAVGEERDIHKARGRLGALQPARRAPLTVHPTCSSRCRAPWRPGTCWACWVPCRSAATALRWTWTLPLLPGRSTRPATPSGWATVRGPPGGCRYKRWAERRGLWSDVQRADSCPSLHVSHGAGPYRRGAHASRRTTPPSCWAGHC